MTKKDYTITIQRGRLTLTMNKKGADGLIHSASCEYPYYDRVVNEKGQIESVRRNKPTIEKMLLRQLGYSPK